MAILAVVVSCGGADKVAAKPAPEGDTVSAPPPRAQVDPALVGTEWPLVSPDGDELLSETDTTLEIDEEIVSGSAGCNAYGGLVEKMTGGSIDEG
jgi:heat shock protein HslJ